MTVFRYNALTADGKKTAGTLEAATRREATQVLRERGMHVTSIRSSGGAIFEFGRVSRNRSEQTYLFTSHMRRLLRARLPLLEALDATATELAASPIGTVIGRVRSRVAGGSPLAEALAGEADYFDTLYVSMVRAAQASGTLALAFETIHQHEMRKRDFNRRLQSALAYPMVLIAVAVLAVMFLMSYVVPKITLTLLSAKVTLPALTRALIAVSGLAERYWVVILAVIALAAFSPRLLKSSKGGRRAVDRFLVRTPVVRRFARSAIIARLSRTFSSLLGTGLRVADALDVAAEVSGSMIYEEALAQARSRIVSGGDLSDALSESGLFPGYAVQIMAIGERTGTLHESFEEIAHAEEEDLEAATARFLTFLEPAIIVVMAVVVGLIVASVLLPILSMSTMAGT